MTQESVAIKPFITEEGIELYATDTECGMSQRGLARFVGKDEARIREVLAATVRGSTTSECLKPFIGKELWGAVEGEKGAKIVKSEVVAAICEYYAFEAKEQSETARYSYRKFAKLGIDSWIRTATGHKEVTPLTPEQMTIQLFQRCLETETKLRITTEKLLEKEQYITRAIVNAPGLQKLLDDTNKYAAEDEDNLKLVSREEAKETFTLAEYIAYYKFPIPDKMYRQFRLKVAGFFETLRHYTPKKELRYSKAGSPNMSYVYTKEDLGFLDCVFMQVAAAYSPKD